jgi:hypothetical protein
MLKMIAFILFLSIICIAGWAVREKYDEKLVHQDNPLNRPFVLKTMPSDFVYDPWDDICEDMTDICKRVDKMCRKKE